MEERRKGFLDLSTLIRKHKDKVTYEQILVEVCNEGWYKDFRRLNIITVTNAIKRHNDKVDAKNNVR